MVANPHPFELSEAEARRVMVVQSDRQTAFAREGARVQRMTLFVPFALVAAMLLLDRFVLGETTPGWVFFGLIAAYLIGSFVQILAMAVTMKETKLRMLVATPQVWEQRTISIDNDGLAQDTPTSRSLYSWNAFRSMEREDDILWLWLTEFNAVVVPLRAFESEHDANAFEAETQRMISVTDE